MSKPRIPTALALLVTGALLFSGCSSTDNNISLSKTHQDTDETQQNQTTPSDQTPTPDAGNDTQDDSGSKTGTQEPSSQPASSAHELDKAAVTEPTSVTVLVNKQYALPDGYKPSDLIDDPNLPFIFSGYDEKRLIRKVAAQALEKLFAAAQEDGIYLAGVSAFRSYELQTSLFNSYVQTQGEAEARRYSAVPGHSEHQTGLAIDVSGSTGACAAENCFGDTPEATWLADHAAEYGFIIRYPQGKEAITGYAYEPWHLRYVGVDVAQDMKKQGLTFEEYVAQQVPELK
ncbi:MAG TPA: M15 family metallopeptidase [Bacilli bacterium]|nr:M15 family metallopeptidase [Bacilli bacterium]